MSSQKRNSDLVQQIRTFRVAHQVTDDAIQNFLSALDCPRSLAVWLLYKSKDESDHRQLVDLDINPNAYADAFGFRDAYTATLFLSKSDFLNIGIDKKEAAYTKFLKFEEQCKQTNRRFRSLHSALEFTGSNVWLLNAVERKIASILGDFTCEEVVASSNWGPGVTTKLHGCHVSGTNKFHCENGITRDLYSLIWPWFYEAYPKWTKHLVAQYGYDCFDYQVGNVVITVPKNSKIDRVIAVEPGLNLWFQKSAGSMIRRRLARRGLDLNNQHQVNQSLARSSSRDGRLATVDFSSASDSISLEVVKALLPPRWFQLLDCFRSKYGRLGDRVFCWEKFSSMGNGFTFELETLIFYATALCVCEHAGVSTEEVSVFGDDVVLPTAVYSTFSSFCEFLGFTLNHEKSFHDGYFRESCGSHFYGGVDTKPIFLKERLHHASSIYKLANNVRLLSHRRCCYYGCDRSFHRCWASLVHWLPQSLRLRIPYGLGDVGLISNFDEAVPACIRRAPNCIEGFYVTALGETGVTQAFEGTGLLLNNLWNGSTRESGNTYTLRGRTKIRVSRILCPRWYSLGGWL